MAITYSTPGQYTLGGISAPRTGVSESFRAGVQANLGRQDAKQTMRQREQQMALAQSEEARRAQLFELGLEDRRRAIAQQAAAAARAAQARQAQSALMAGLAGVGGTGGAAPTGTIAPAAPPRAGVALPTGTGAPLSFSTAAPSAAAPTVTPSAPLTGGGGSGVVTGGVNDRAGGAGDDMLGLQLQGADPRRAEAESFGAGVRGAVGGVLDRAAGAVSAAGSGLYGLGTDVLGAGAAVVGAPGVAAGLERQSDIAYNIALTNLRQGLSATSGVSAEDLDMEPTEFRAAVRQAEETAAAEGVPSSPEAAGGAAQRAGLSFGGQLPGESELTLDMGEVIQRTEGEPSQIFRGNPALQLRQLEVSERRLDQITAEMNYYDQTGNTEMYLDAVNRYYAEQENQFFLNGMVAVSSLESGRFGQAQELLQSQWFPNQEVELRPYTDGTVDVIVGENSERLEWEELANFMRSGYDRQAIEFQQSLGEAQREGVLRAATEAPLKELEASLARETALLEQAGNFKFGDAIETDAGTVQLGTVTLQTGQRLPVQARAVEVPIPNTDNTQVEVQYFIQDRSGAFTVPLTPDILEYTGR